jgi:hypothetical protein
MNIQISTEKLQQLVVHTARRPRRFIRLLIRLAVVLFLIMAAALTYLRIVGLPEGFKERVLQELQKQGLEISVGKFYIDPLGRLVGRDVDVVQLVGEDRNVIVVDRVRFDFNWISWWRGQPFLHGADVANAGLSYGLDAGTAIRLRNVQMEIEFGPEKTLRIVRAEADVANIHLKLDGDVNLTAFKLGVSPLTPEQRAARVRLWNQINEYLAQIESPRPIRVEVEIHSEGPVLDQAEGHLLIEVRDAVWRETRFSLVSIEVDYADKTARAQVNVNLPRGGLEVQGSWKMGQTKVDAMFHSDMDLTLLRHLFPKEVENILAETQFRSLPVNQGEISADWTSGKVAFQLQARAIWNHVVVRGAEIQSLYLPVSYDGRRILIPEMQLKTERGEATFSFFYNGESSVEGRLESSLDPTFLKPLFGPGAQPFMNSLSFREGPHVKAKITGTALQPDVLRIEGDVAVGPFTYKGASLDEAVSHFVFENKELVLTNVHAKRPEGSASGVEVRDNFATKLVTLKGVSCQMLPQETAIIFGNKLAEYLKPYRFAAAPKVKLEGVIDLDTRAKTSFDVMLDSPEGMKYDFLKKTLNLTQLKAKLEFRGKNLRVTTLAPAHIFGGEADMVLKLLLDGTDIPYTADIRARDCLLEQVLNTYFTNEEDLAGQVTASAHLTGRFNDIKSIKGPGQMTVKDGTLYRIPILGSFSDVLNDIVPNIGYSKASNADVDFDFADGILNVSKVDVFSTGFALIGHGQYDYVQDKVDFSMRVNMRGLPGLLLFSISKLFEYQGTGTMKKTTWEPKVF